MTTNKTEQELAEAVRQLTAVVRGVQDMMRQDYPKRDEIERDFVSKYGVKKRRIQFAVATVVAIMASYFFTMGTISYCFLDGPGVGGTYPKPFCQLLPGYSGVYDYNQERLDTYQDFIDRVQIDKLRIDKIEEELRSR